jgi:MFS superfamily sulfate permease-like transporter
VVVLIPFADILKDVPLTTLAAILIFVAVRLFHLRELAAIARFDLFEFGLAAITLFAVALVGVEQGIGVAVGLAILDRIRRSARPQIHVLGRIPGTTSWAPRSADPHAEMVPGVLVLLFATPLWYANATAFREEVARALAGVPDVRVLVLDAIGMSDIDFTGTRALGRVIAACERDGIAIGVARASDRVRESLRRSGLEARIGEERFYPAVGVAVAALGGPSAR